MPFYEYECSNCKFYTEVMQKISDTPLTKCPSCGKQALKKLVSAPNFRLKGGGWYETDFKGDKENRRNLAGPDKEESSKPEAVAESSKSETPKAETSKPQAATVETSSKPASRSGSGSRSSTGAKASSGKSGAKPAKPSGKVAASKGRSAPAVRSKAKPAAARKKKSRR